MHPARLTVQASHDILEDELLRRASWSRVVHHGARQLDLPPTDEAGDAGWTRRERQRRSPPGAEQQARRQGDAGNRATGSAHDDHGRDEQECGDRQRDGRRVGICVGGQNADRSPDEGARKRKSRPHQVAESVSRG